MSLFNKKTAAMFGLDGRIAMALFATISVFTGALLYDALDEIDYTKTYYEAKEIMKAYEAYRVDTKRKLKQLSTNSSDWQFYFLRMKDLMVDPGVRGWKGPYLDGYVPATWESNSDLSVAKKQNDTITYDIMLGNTNAAWGSENASGSPITSFQGLCTSGKDCATWVRISRMPRKDIIVQIDEEYDNGNGPSAGDIRWAMNGSLTWYYYYFKHIPIKNPN